jgi:axial budding pattern protein 2
MQCTLVIVSDPVPTLQGDLGEQLAATANLSSSNPAVMTLLPGSAFDFHFRQDSFIDIVRQRSLYYYATLADHTPLPAWLHFDAAQLTFEGVAPTLSAFPQSFDWGEAVGVCAGGERGEG